MAGLFRTRQAQPVKATLYVTLPHLREVTTPSASPTLCKTLPPSRWFASPQPGPCLRASHYRTPSLSLRNKAASKRPRLVEKPVPSNPSPRLQWTKRQLADWTPPALPRHMHPPRLRRHDRRTMHSFVTRQPSKFWLVTPQAES